MNLKEHEACNFNYLFTETKDFSRSQPVTFTYTVNVETSRKRCQIESLLLMQTTNIWPID